MFCTGESRCTEKGVSLLYRDSLITIFDVQEMMSPPIDNLFDAFTKDICVTDQKAPAREMVGDYLFEFTAGDFFSKQQYHGRLIARSHRFGEGHPTHLIDT